MAGSAKGIRCAVFKTTKGCISVGVVIYAAKHYDDICVGIHFFYTRAKITLVWRESLVRIVLLRKAASANAVVADCGGGIFLGKYIYK